MNTTTFRWSLFAILPLLPIYSHGNSPTQDQSFFLAYTGHCHVPIPSSMSFDFSDTSFYVPESTINKTFEDLEAYMESTRTIRFFREGKPPSVELRGEQRKPLLKLDKGGFQLVELTISRDTYIYYITSGYSSVIVSYAGFQLDYAEFAFEFCISHRNRLLSE